MTTNHKRRPIPKVTTIYNIVSTQDITKQLNKEGISNEELQKARKSYFQPIDNLSKN